MSKNKAFRIAASTIVIGLTVAGCSKPFAYRPPHMSANAPKAERDAGRHYSRAHVAIQKGNTAKALTAIETAVELSPRDLGYRMVLGDLYLKSGRFVSAEQAFVDVLTLDPANTRAALSLSLSQIAQGKHAQALVHLDRLSQTAAPGDLGLAYALAGQSDRAISMLEYAARQPGADGKVRQNLALAYALAGDWPKARAFAAQDVSPADLGARLQQWAAFAQPKDPHSQVASLLGIENVPADTGQPARLALAPEAPEPVMVAEAAEPALQAPVEVRAEVVAVEAPKATPETAQQVLLAATQVEAPVEPAVEQAVESLVQPAPAVIPAAAPASAPLPAFKPAEARTSFAPLRPKKSNGRFVVQIGAFKTQIQTERAWLEAQKRYSFADREPLSTTVSIAGKGTFHRLSVSGFDSSVEANRLCGAIKAKGGACFVRTSAGDIPVQWASRRAGPRG